jgi:hypothetical protein
MGGFGRGGDRGGEDREGDRGGRGGGFGRDEESSAATKALSDLLKQEDPPAEEIQKKLSDLRAERAQSEKALKVSRDKLREVLTAKQEARLVLQGLLD